MHLLLSSEKVFAWKVDDITPSRVPFVHEFELEDYTSICEPLRKTFPEDNRIFDEEV